MPRLTTFDSSSDEDDAVIFTCVDVTKNDSSFDRSCVDGSSNSGRGEFMLEDVSLSTSLASTDASNTFGVFSVLFDTFDSSSVKSFETDSSDSLIGGINVSLGFSFAGGT